MSRRASIIFLLSLATSALITPQASFGQVVPSYSVEEFVAKKSRWKAWATAKLRIRIEGRSGAIAGGLMRLQNCDLSFRRPDNKAFSKSITRNRNVEVDGHIVLRNRRPLFLVDRLTQTPTDLSTFTGRRLGIENPQKNEAAWYALSNWAAGRAKFYGDDELLEKANEAKLRGFSVERDRLKDDDVAGRFTLAKKATDLKLSDDLHGELIHEALQLRYAVLKTDKKADLAPIAKDLAAAFPGCKTPLKKDEPLLRKEYWKAPLGVYRNSGASQRATLQRFFYAELILQSIVQGAKPDGSNGLDIADNIDRLLPEQHALAESYRDRRIAYELASVATYSRQQLDDLTARFRKRKQPAKAREAITAWVAAQEARLRKSGAVGLMQAADYYRTLLDDNEKSLALLIEAYQADPESKDVTARLDRLGYALENGRWILKGKRKTVKPNAIEQAIRDGRIIAGMTTEHVRKTLGEPTSVTRVASAGQVNEVWIYGEQKTSRLAIHFLRRARQPVNEARTIAVSNVSER